VNVTKICTGSTDKFQYDESKCVTEFVSNILLSKMNAFIHNKNRKVFFITSTNLLS
jgi:hypothetical protein